jgi:HK97 family phage prohead protease
MKYEIRQLKTPPPTLSGRTLSGIAIPYNSLSLNLGGFVERFMPGSVSDTIKSGQIELWAHHDRSKPIGSQASGMKLWEEKDGLHYSADLPEKNTDAENVMSLLNRDRPIIGGTSFGFMPVGSSGERWLRENGQNVREIIKAEIEHLSPVVTPAYPATSAILRSLQEGKAGGLADIYGIDLDMLAGIFLAQKRGLTVSESETEVARQAISLLSATIRTPKLKSATDQAARLLM